MKTWIFDVQSIKLLLRWLMYNCDDYKTYHSLCLVNRYCGLELAREYSPMKKNEFSYIDEFTITLRNALISIGIKNRCIFLPNGLAHGIWYINNYQYVYKDGVMYGCIENTFNLPKYAVHNAGFTKNWRMGPKYKKVGNYIFCDYQLHQRCHINSYFIFRSRISFEFEIVYVKCPCRKPHMFYKSRGNGYVLAYACKCGESNLRWDHFPRAAIGAEEYVRMYYQTRKSRIRGAIVEYAMLKKLIRKKIKC